MTEVLPFRSFGRRRVPDVRGLGCYLCKSPAFHLLGLGILAARIRLVERDDAGQQKPCVAIRLCPGHNLVAEFIGPPKVYTFSFIVGTIIPKSVKCIHSATKTKKAALLAFRHPSKTHTLRQPVVVSKQGT